MPVLKPYKLASREFAAAPTIVRVGDDVAAGRDATFGGPAHHRHRRSLLGGRARDAATRPPTPCATPGDGCCAAARSSRARRRTPSRDSAREALKMLAEVRRDAPACRS